MNSFHLTLLPEALAICRLPPESPLPMSSAGASALFSVTRTADELSLVCREDAIPPGAAHEPGWRALKVQGPLDFSLVGVLANLSTPLAAAGVSLFAISTFDTDYLLVKQPQLEAALTALHAAGHRVHRP